MLSGREMIHYVFGTIINIFVKQTKWIIHLADTGFSSQFKVLNPDKDTVEEIVGVRMKDDFMLFIDKGNVFQRKGFLPDTVDKYEMDSEIVATKNKALDRFN